MIVEESMAKKKTEIPRMITETKAKEFARSIEPDIRMSGDFIGELNTTLSTTIENAVRRATDNNRKTLKPCDL